MSTEDTSMQGGTGRDARLHLDSHSSATMRNQGGGDEGLLEETKTAVRGGPHSRRDRLPPELGRPSLSESTGASKKFSPQFDKRSSHTKEDAMLGVGDRDILEDSESANAQCRGFVEN